MAALRDTLAQFVSDVFASTRARPADPAARRLLHERHAGRHARSIACSARSAAGSASRRTRWRRRPGRGKAYLRRAAAEGRADRRVGARRREPAARDEEGGRGSSAPTPRSCSLTVLGLVVLSVSYARNRAYIAEVASRRRDVAAGAARSPRARRSRPCCRASTPCARSSIPRTAIATTGRGRCAGGSIRAPRSATRRAMPTCASSTASCCRDSRRACSSASSSYGSEPEKLYVYLEGVPDAGRAEASRQGAPASTWRISNGRAATATSRRRASRPRSISRALLDYGDTLRPIALDPALVAQARSHDSAGLGAADHMQPDPGQLRHRHRARRAPRRRRRHRRSRRCSSARAASACRSRCPASMGARCSRTSPAGAPRNS